MDPEAFLDLANQVAKLKMYPYFELAHAAVCCLVIKEDMGSGSLDVIKLNNEIKLRTSCLYTYNCNCIKI